MSVDVTEDSSISMTRHQLRLPSECAFAAMQQFSFATMRIIVFFRYHACVNVSATMQHIFRYRARSTSMRIRSSRCTETCFRYHVNVYRHHRGFEHFDAQKRADEKVSCMSIVSINIQANRWSDSVIDFNLCLNDFRATKFQRITNRML